MIIIRLFGGLGNQLFQYALGRRLSLLHKVALKLDISQIEKYKIRKYNLQAFNIIENFATEEDVIRIKGKGRVNFRRVIERVLPYYKRSYVDERYFHFDPNILRSRKNVYLNGFWQSEKYFKDIKLILRNEFTFRQDSNYQIEKMVNKIESLNAICLNVRRGDYVTNPGMNKFHGICPMEYYENAIQYIKTHVRNPHFFIFSDDIEWCRDNLRLTQPFTLVTHEYAGANFECYFKLITACKHFIIPNSTFGWWGAWLSQNHNKIVIAPKEWFNVNNIDTKDLIPEDWIRI